MNMNNMTQEDNDLLLKDISVRLPYKVIAVTIAGDVKGRHAVITGVTEFGVYLGDDHYTTPFDEISYYLRPMSSMTEKEKEDFENLLEGIVDGIERWNKPDMCEEYDWLNSHHFDYRGLIEKGLALEAPEDMYKEE